MAMAEMAESWKDRRRATMTATVGPQFKEGGILEERPAASGLGWVLYFMGGRTEKVEGWGTAVRRRKGPKASVG
jgi:hypothetical protein